MRIVGIAVGWFMVGFGACYALWPPIELPHLIGYGLWLGVTTSFVIVITIAEIIEHHPPEKKDAQ